MPLQPGMIGSKRAKFRIAWTRQVAPNELQAGVESLDLHNVWAVDLSDGECEAKNDVQALMTILAGCSKTCDLIFDLDFLHRSTKNRRMAP
jgi:hypothetical protein